MEAWKRYNKMLKADWSAAPDGRAMFRLAITNNQYEWRKGEFSRFTEGGIFLGTDVGIKQVPKYFYLGYSEIPHWVLEGLMFIQGGMNEPDELRQGCV